MLYKIAKGNLFAKADSPSDTTKDNANAFGQVYWLDWLFLHAQLKFEPYNIMGDGNNCTCKGCIRLTANTSQDCLGFNLFQSTTIQYKPTRLNLIRRIIQKTWIKKKKVSADLTGSTKFCIQVKIAWQANGNHAGHAAHDPAWNSWRLWRDTYLEASEYMRQSTAFLHHSVTTSCGACPCSPDASLLALAPGHAERTPMSSWILVPGPFKTKKFD